MLHKTLILAAALVVIAVTVFAQGWNIEQVSLLYDNWGMANEVAVQGNYAYIAEEFTGLRIVDISEPSTPQEIGSYYFGDTQNFAVAVLGNYAYLAAGFYEGLRIIDISDSFHPFETGFINTIGCAADVAVNGSRAYITDVMGGALRIIDISNPANPILLGSCDSLFMPLSLDIAGNYAYIADQSDGLKIINIANSTNPFLAGQLSNVDAKDVAVSGSYAYVVNYNANTLDIIDISTPANPVLTGAYLSTSYPYCIEVFGNYAYLGSGISLEIIDISNSANPILSGFCEVPGWTANACYLTNYLYSVNAEAGLQILDVTNPGSPHIEGSYNTGFACGLALEQDYAYIADYDAGIKIINITDPDNPVEISSCDTPGEAVDIAVADSYAYVAEGLQGLHIINVSNPGSPQEIASLNTAEYICNVETQSCYVYTLSNFTAVAAIRIIDVSDPFNPSQTGYYNLPDFSWYHHFALLGSFIYATADSLLLILDISNPANPVLTGSCSLPYEIRSLAVTGEYAYAGSFELYIIDVSNPTNPFITETTENYNSTKLAVSGDTLYYVDFWGVRVFDISDRLNPVEMGTCELPLMGGIFVPIDLKTNESYIYLANNFHFQIFHCSENSVNNPGFNLNPLTFNFFPASPNPFNAETKITYILPHSGEISLKIFDLQGREVQSLVNSHQSMGTHSAIWKAESVSSGIYFARLEAGDYSQTQKLALLK